MTTKINRNSSLRTGTHRGEHGSVNVTSTHGVGAVDPPIRHHEIRVGVRLLFNPAGHIIAGAGILGAEIVIEANQCDATGFERSDGLSRSIHTPVKITRRDTEIVEIEAHQANQK